MENLIAQLAQIFGTIVEAQTQGQFVPISDGFKQMIGDNITLQTGDFGQFVNSLYKLSIRIAAAVAIAMFVWGGIMYMVAPFGVAGEGIGKAKERMQNAVLGLLMLLATWVIFNQINPDILNLKINAAPLKAISAPTQSNTNTTQPAAQSLNNVETKNNDGSTNCTGYDALGNAQPC